MKKSEHFRWTRRDFLSVAPAVLAGSLLAERAGAEERPAVTNPRATAGDAVEPKWDSRLTITVGPQKADLVGADEKAIQAGVDYIAAEGGGTLHILPGTYRLRNAVSLRTGVRILGSGPDSVLVKAPQVKSKSRWPMRAAFKWVTEFACGSTTSGTKATSSFGAV
jgi:hypothetical protein